MRTVPTLLAAAVLGAVLVGCSAPAADGNTKSSASADTPTNEATTPLPEPSDLPSDEPASPPIVIAPPPELLAGEVTAPLAPECEVELVAKALRGECYEDEPDDKREVARVICNRVSTGGFGDSIEAVITAPMQFVGYRPDNVPSDNDYAIAREILTEWYAGGCAPLGEYLFFSSGAGHRNAFRKNY